MRMQGGRVRGNKPDECHTTWPENLTDKWGGKEWRIKEVVWRNGRQKKATLCPTMIVIVIRVLNQGTSWGGLQVVEKVVGPSQSEFQGGPKWQKWWRCWSQELDYGSDNFSSASDVSTPKPTMRKHSIKKLLKKIEEKDKMIRSLELELSKSKVILRMNKTKVWEELKWTGEETNFTKTVNHFCWHWLFPKFKFLKYGWVDTNSAG